MIGYNKVINQLNVYIKNFYFGKSSHFSKEFLFAEFEAYSSRINIRLKKVLENSLEFYMIIKKHPSDLIALIDLLFWNNFNQIFNKSYLINEKIKPKIFFLDDINQEQLFIHEIGNKDINKLISLQGIIYNSTQIIYQTTIAFFSCDYCLFENFSVVENGFILQPLYCFNCKNFHTYEFKPQKSMFFGKQFVFITNFVDGMITKSSNTIVPLLVSDENIFEWFLGENIVCTGIYRAAIKKPAINYPENTFLSFFIEVISIHPNQSIQFDLSNRSIKMKKKLSQKNTPENEVLFIKINSISQNLNFKNFILDPLFPQYLGNKLLKKCLSQFFHPKIKTQKNKKFFQEKCTRNLLIINCDDDLEIAIRNTFSRYYWRCFITGSNYFEKKGKLKKKLEPGNQEITPGFGKKAPNGEQKVYFLNSNNSNYGSQANLSKSDAFRRFLQELSNYCEDNDFSQNSHILFLRENIFKRNFIQSEKYRIGIKIIFDKFPFRLNLGVSSNSLKNRKSSIVYIINQLISPIKKPGVSEKLGLNLESSRNLTSANFSTIFAKISCLARLEFFKLTSILYNILSLEFNQKFSTIFEFIEDSYLSSIDLSLQRQSKLIGLEDIRLIIITIFELINSL